MIRNILGVLIITFAALVIFGADPAGVQAADRHSAPGDLFYNFYVPPVGPHSVGAALYLSPRPVPPVVGHTYITYQPLMPHEFLYKHHRTYSYMHSEGETTHVSVTWH